MNARKAWVISEGYQRSEIYKIPYPPSSTRSTLPTCPLLPTPSIFPTGQTVADKSMLATNCEPSNKNYKFPWNAAWICVEGGDSSIEYEQTLV